MCHPNALALFLYLIAKASRYPRKAPTQHGIVNLEAGQCVTGRNKLKAVFKLSDRNIRTALHFLEKYEYVTIAPTKGYSIITVINYEKYQTQEDSPTKGPTKTRPRPDQDPTTSKESRELENISSASVGGPSPKDYTDIFYAAYELKYGVKPSPPPQAFINLTRRVKAGLELEDWKGCVAGYFNASWVKTHSLESLVSGIDKFRTAPKVTKQTRFC